ncbi:MAG: BREX-3 system P-loop-containing protein BrxF [Proteobacteria bacterium]|nr:BREX-3 system P-loop-containing protein BrxF [Pseudomonadota bacterium]
MPSRLEQLTANIGDLHSRLILIIGPPKSGKTLLLRVYGESKGIAPFNLGAALGRRLIGLSHRQRQFQAAEVLHELIAQHTPGDLLLIDNIELLFDASLKLNPLDLLKRHAHIKKVISIWPGDLRDGRLVYAELNHPEYRDYAAEGVVHLRIEQQE